MFHFEPGLRTRRPKSFAGGGCYPESLRIPSFNSITRPSLRAKSRAWVTTISVTPSSRLNSSRRWASSRRQRGPASRWVLGEQQLRLINEGAHDGDALAFPPESWPGRWVGVSRGRPDSTAARPVAARSRATRGRRWEASAQDVFQHGALRQQMMRLKNKADLAVSNRRQLRSWFNSLEIPARAAKTWPVTSAVRVCR